MSIKYAENCIQTYEEVITKLKDTKLENYTTDELIARYIVYGTEEELNTSSIQLQLIKHNLCEELLAATYIIKDRNVIKQLLSNRAFKNQKFKVIQGKVIKIQKTLYRKA